MDPNKYDDPRVQELSDHWQGLTSTKEQIEKAGMAYLAHILGVGKDAADKFLAGDSEAYHEVGMKQSAIPFVNGPAFCREIGKIFPKIHSQEQFRCLIKECGVFAVLNFLNVLEPPAAERTRMFRLLGTNAHAYK